MKPPYVNIQWKGTDACIDLYCNCGEYSHFDGFFAYYFVCVGCGKYYQTGYTVKLKEVTEEIAGEMVKLLYDEDDEESVKRMEKYAEK